MRITRLTVISLCFFANLLSAQKATLTWSDRTEPDEQSRYDILALAKDNSANYFHFARSKWTMYPYNSGMKKGSQKSITVEGLDKECMTDQFLQARDHSYLLYCTVPRKGDCKLLAAPVSKDMSGEIKAQEVVSTPPQIQPIDDISRMPQNRWGIGLSADSTKIVGRYLLLHERGVKGTRIGIVVWSEDMKQLWKQEYTLPHGKDEFNYERYYVTNNGNEAYVIYTVIDNSTPNEKEQGSHYEIARFRKGKAEADILKLEYKGQYADHFVVDESPKGELVIGTFVMQSFMSNLSTGFVLLTMAENGKEFNTYGKSSYQVPENELKRMLENKADRINSKENKFKQHETRGSWLTMESMKFQPDGTLKVIWYEAYSTLRAMTNYNGSSVTQSFADDIYIWRINPDGSIKSMIDVPRASDRADLFVASTPDVDYLCIRENQANVTRDLQKEKPLFTDTKTPENNVYTLVRVKADGSQSRVKLLPQDIRPADAKKYRYEIKTMRTDGADNFLLTFREVVLKTGQDHPAALYLKANVSW